MPVITKYVSASGDDGGWRLATASPTQRFRASEPVEFAGYFQSSSSQPSIYGTWHRIDEYGIPQGSVVNNADIHIPVDDILDGATTIAVRLYDSNDPSAPTTYSQAQNATLTSASEEYETDDFSTVAVYDITDALQEVVNRPGFDESSAIVVDVRSIYNTLNEVPPRQVATGNIQVSFKMYDSGNPAWIVADYTPPNTAPEITVTPSVDYGSLTRLGPNNSPISVEFTATDAEDTGTDDLTWEIRTAASGGGTLVATGDCTSGASENAGIAYDDSGIGEGSNTLYLRVGDGTAWSDDESFTLLMDSTAPSISGISHSPDPITEQ